MLQTVVPIAGRARYTAAARAVWPTAAAPLAGAGIGVQQARLVRIAKTGEVAPVAIERHRFSDAPGEHAA